MQEVPASRELLDRALQDQEAFAVLVDKHKAMVYSLVYNFFHSRSIAEDIAQDAYLDLYRNLNRIESDKHLAFWLRQTVTRKCIDWSRRQKHRRYQPLDEAPEPGVDPQMRDLMLQDALASKVAALPEKMRVVVVLRFQEDLKLTEIAETLDVPVNTVKTTLRRALDRLRPKVSHLAEEVAYGPVRA